MYRSFSLAYKSWMCICGTTAIREGDFNNNKGQVEAYWKQDNTDIHATDQDVVQKPIDASLMIMRSF